MRGGSMFPKAGYYFVALLLIAIFAFWIPWYSNMFGDHTIWKNFHAVVMTLWLLLLISQAFLMRFGKLAEHHKLGKVSFVLGPICIISFPLLAASMFPPEGMAVPPFRAYVLWLQIGLGGLFAWFFLAAIYYRKEPVRHARYMIATALTLIDPIVVRLVIFYGPMAGSEPDMNVAPVELQYVSYVVINIVIIALLLLERNQTRGRDVFPKVFAGFIVFEILTFTMATSQPWTDFANWLANLIAI